MVGSTNGIWVKESLPPGMSTQKVKLMALTKTSELGDSKKINIHMDNRYAFATAHVHKVYMPKELLTSEKTNRKS